MTAAPRLDQQTDLFGNPVLKRSAYFATPGVRVRLTRHWAEGPKALVIGCNPSDADASKEDMTSHWWNAWFHRFGFGGYCAMNAYPFCSPDPAICKDRVSRALNGPNWHDRDMLFSNRDAIAKAAKKADQVFVCWGAIAWDEDWLESIIEEIQQGSAPWPDLWCWGKTAAGAPKHPLARGVHRIPRNQAPILWRAGSSS